MAKKKGSYRNRLRGATGLKQVRRAIRFSGNKTRAKALSNSVKKHGAGAAGRRASKASLLRATRKQARHMKSYTNRPKSKSGSSTNRLRAATQIKGTRRSARLTGNKMKSKALSNSVKKHGALKAGQRASKAGVIRATRKQGRHMSSYYAAKGKPMPKKFGKVLRGGKGQRRDKNGRFA